ncbi:hypothetical protein BJ508DRAFT_232093 [Ascobolus immersus RN42]|uniref:Multifunctional tryptophan biosynthesis protein n=1 Tax=Ascobolus immersus RN42 TaxID=1160509 RepID=A0A3N4HBJ9_ASCIM|nr:hypothetical protein BJ508DRAFT_232093 [Ascobolus immersus RN42]
MPSRASTPPPPIPTASNVVMIDNYDSFTWNVYQYLVLEGAKVQVFRNDKITLEELIALNPTQLVVSPGPGHPETDSGISKPAIKHFAGKIPVLGVCMGEQCIFSAFGGTVSYAGEIVHGKTSQIQHDGRGIYKNVPQSIAVTRYHSLAGTAATLPPDLEVTSWTGPNKIIMGVRHKTYTVEGVQYHPESILTEEGRLIIQNFLHMTGGTWAECEAAQAAEPPAQKEPSILDRIYAQRRLDISTQMQLPSQRPSDLQTLYNLGLAPPLISLPARLRQIDTTTALLAEIKRASPSKGDIDLSASAALQARTYALSGAAAISVLTEPTWFKGTLDDLRAARAAVEGMPNRPAILRKEFIFSTYQILEARLAGADTVLLIVKMLNDTELKELYDYSLSLGMEPLVEVNNPAEMARALAIGSKVIGVNNRNLHDFKVDLETTSGLVSMIDPKDVILVALSGISSRADVERYESEGVGAVLVGESLMRAGAKVGDFIAQLLGQAPTAPVKKDTLVKICGTRTVEAAKVAVESGADLVGIILAENTKRTISVPVAKAISDVVHTTGKGGIDTPLQSPVGKSVPHMAHPPQQFRNKAVGYFTHTTRHLLSSPHRALLVGVFRDQPLEYVLSMTRLLDLDIVQLHGHEPLEWATLIPVPVIRRFSPGEQGMFTTGLHAAALIDAGAGGTGQQVEVSGIQEVAKQGQEILLAGGLDEKNVLEVIEEAGDVVAGVDVSSGVETDGRQDLRKIRRFVYRVKGRDLKGL